MIDLTLRHLWTRTGAPVTWRIEGQDERDFRDLLRSLDERKADPERRSAVLLAVEDDGTVIGAWNREGAEHLWHMLDAIPRSAGLLKIRHALMDAAATGQ